MTSPKRTGSGRRAKEAHSVQSILTSLLPKTRTNHTDHLTADAFHLTGGSCGFSQVFKSSRCTVLLLFSNDHSCTVIQTVSATILRHQRVMEREIAND